MKTNALTQPSAREIRQMSLALDTLKFYRELIGSAVFCSMRSMLAAHYTIELHMHMSRDGSYGRLKRIICTPGAGPEVKVIEP